MRRSARYDSYRREAYQYASGVSAMTLEELMRESSGGRALDNRTSNEGNKQRASLGTRKIYQEENEETQ